MKNIFLVLLMFCTKVGFAQNDKFNLTIDVPIEKIIRIDTMYRDFELRNFKALPFKDNHYIFYNYGYPVVIDFEKGSCHKLQEFISYDFGINQRIEQLYFDTTANLAIFSNQQRETVLFNYSTQKYKKYPNQNHAFVTAYLAEKDTIWIGFADGLAIYDKSKDTLYAVKEINRFWIDKIERNKKNSLLLNNVVEFNLSTKRLETLPNKVNNAFANQYRTEGKVTVLKVKENELYIKNDETKQEITLKGYDINTQFSAIDDNYIWTLLSKELTCLDYKNQKKTIIDASILHINHSVSLFNYKNYLLFQIKNYLLCFDKTEQQFYILKDLKTERQISFYLNNNLLIYKLLEINISNLDYLISKKVKLEKFEQIETENQIIERLWKLKKIDEVQSFEQFIGKWKEIETEMAKQSYTMKGNVHYRWYSIQERIFQDKEFQKETEEYVRKNTVDCKYYDLIYPMLLKKLIQDGNLSKAIEKYNFYITRTCDKKFANNSVSMDAIIEAQKEIKKLETQHLAMDKFHWEKAKILAKMAGNIDWMMDDLGGADLSLSKAEKDIIYKKYPNSEYIPQIAWWKTCSKMDRWECQEHAGSEYNVKLIKQYLEKYPNSNMKVDAYRALYKEYFSMANRKDSTFYQTQNYYQLAVYYKNLLLKKYNKYLIENELLSEIENFEKNMDWVNWKTTLTTTKVIFNENEDIIINANVQRINKNGEISALLLDSLSSNFVIDIELDSPNKTFLGEFVRCNRNFIIHQYITMKFDKNDFYREKINISKMVHYTGGCYGSYNLPKGKYIAIVYFVGDNSFTEAAYPAKIHFEIK